MKILLIEDEDSIREVEKAYLKRAGFVVTECEDGEKGMEAFRKEKFDLVLLDLNLPGKDGVEICKEIRSFSQVPIIMATARVEEIDELLGLEVGADDYIKKPFSPNILVARVNSLLRRIGGEVIEIDSLRIDPEKMQATIDGIDIGLTTTQFNILFTMAKNPGKVFTREEILDRAYDDILPNYVLDRTVDAHIKSIRKALGDDPKESKYIITVIGKGYKFSDRKK
jgi:two-component system, OmpR family, response regulator BaeR